MTGQSNPGDGAHRWSIEGDARLLEEYLRVGIPVDFLAYTKEFDRLYEAFVSGESSPSQAEVFRRLLNLRKRGLMPRLFKHHAEEEGGTGQTGVHGESA